MRDKKDITICFIPNILSEEGRLLKAFPYNRNWTIRRYLKQSGFEFKDMQIAINSVAIKNLRKHLTIGDEIVIMPYIEDMGISSIISSVFQFIMAHPFISMGIAATVGTTAYSVYSAMTTKIKAPSFSVSGDSLDASFKFLKG